MLAIVDLPAALEDLHLDSQKSAAEIAAALASIGREERIKGNENLLAAGPTAYLFMKSGFCRFFLNGKLVRLYTTNDFVLPPAVEDGTAIVTSEFATDVVVFPRAAFLEALRADSPLFSKWSAYLECQNQLMQGLCAVYATEEIRPDAKLKQFEAGEVIIEEGTAPNEIFVMLDGEASASVAGVDVGTIGSGEVFGEMSFFTNQPRTATVRARTSCAVHVIERENFALLVKFRPQLILDISTTLARRVIGLNERISELEKK